VAFDAEPPKALPKSAANDDEAVADVYADMGEGKSSPSVVAIFFACCLDRRMLEVLRLPSDPYFIKAICLRRLPAPPPPPPPPASPPTWCAPPPPCRAGACSRRDAWIIWEEEDREYIPMQGLSPN
jgi:hypothetical protein